MAPALRRRRDPETPLLALQLDAERELKPFDVVVQRATNHAWINTGNEEALLMGVLVDDGSAT